MADAPEIQEANSHVGRSPNNWEDGGLVILPTVRDPRLITVRRGGTLLDADHRLLALWAADCAEHVLHHFERLRPDDHRPRQAIEGTHAWVRGEVRMGEARKAAFASNAAARTVGGAAKLAALAGGQAAAVPRVAAHDLGAAAYAIRAVGEAAPKSERDVAAREECRWQRELLPDTIRDLVLDDQRQRNDICWGVFAC